MLGENFKAKAWERVCRRQSLLDKPCTRISELFVSTPRIAPTLGTLIKVKPLPTYNYNLCVKDQNLIVWVESELDQKSKPPK